MSGVIELQVYGDVGACADAVRRGRRASEAVEAAGAALRRAGEDSGDWSGVAAEAFRAELGDLGSDLSDLQQRLGDATGALSAFVDELVSVRSKLADVRDFATAHGLAVTGDTVTAPTMPPPDADQATVDAHNEKVRHWNTAVEMAQGARAEEAGAHDQLTSALKKVDGDGWLENLLERLGILPPDEMDGVTGSGWLAGLGLTAFGVQAEAMSRAVLGRWQPWFKGPNGWRLGSPYGLSAWERFKLGLRTGETAARDWRANPYQSVARGRWSTAGKWAGRVGIPITAVTSGWEQWQADADDPSLDTGERVDRTATKAVTTTAGAVAGAKGGALLGGAIGTAIAPGVGTVVGGAVGGLVGGVGGAMAGGAVGDFVNEQWDGAVHAVGDAGEAIGDGLSDAGDALTFWD